MREIPRFGSPTNRLFETHARPLNQTFSHGIGSESSFKPKGPVERCISQKPNGLLKFPLDTDVQEEMAM